MQLELVHPRNSILNCIDLVVATSTSYSSNATKRGDSMNHAPVGALCLSCLTSGDRRMLTGLWWLEEVLDSSPPYVGCMDQQQLHSQMVLLDQPLFLV